ncbi:hypothetical protein RB200_38140 [Streptomyces sp. PmtG]
MRRSWARPGARAAQQRQFGAAADADQGERGGHRDDGVRADRGDDRPRDHVREGLFLRLDPYRVPHGGPAPLGAEVRGHGPDGRRGAGARHQDAPSGSGRVPRRLVAGEEEVADAQAAFVHRDDAQAGRGAVAEAQGDRRSWPGVQVPGPLAAQGHRAGAKPAQAALADAGVEGAGQARGGDAEDGEAVQARRAGLAAGQDHRGGQHLRRRPHPGRGAQAPQGVGGQPSVGVYDQVRADGGPQLRPRLVRHGRARRELDAHEGRDQDDGGDGGTQARHRRRAVGGREMAAGAAEAPHRAAEHPERAARDPRPEQRAPDDHGHRRRARRGGGRLPVLDRRRPRGRSRRRRGGRAP